MSHKRTMGAHLSCTTLERAPRSMRNPSHLTAGPVFSRHCEKRGSSNLPLLLPFFEGVFRIRVRSCVKSSNRTVSAMVFEAMVRTSSREATQLKGCGSLGRYLRGLTGYVSRFSSNQGGHPSSALCRRDKFWRFCRRSRLPTTIPDRTR